MKDAFIVAVLAPLALVLLIALTPRCTPAGPSVDIGGWLVVGCPAP